MISAYNQKLFGNVEEIIGRRLWPHLQHLELPQHHSQELPQDVEVRHGKRN